MYSAFPITRANLFSSCEKAKEERQKRSTNKILEFTIAVHLKKGLKNYKLNRKNNVHQSIY